jgi:LysM repeat protein
MENFKRLILPGNCENMKRYYWLLTSLIALTATAQEKLVVKGKSPDLYVVYSSPAETSLQAISNQFGQSVTKLSTYNKLNPNTALSAGTEIRTKGGGGSAPVYHIVEKGEGLLKISKDNKLTMATMRQWNGLKTDAVKPGDALIIGYMVNARIHDAKQPESKNDRTVKKGSADASIVHADVPVPRKEEHVIKTTEGVPETSTDNNSSVKKDPPPVIPASNSNTEAISRAKQTQSTDVREGDEGYFAVSFAQHEEEQTQQYQTGDAATFKTISGWSDRKYYVLINDVAPETIVRITASNNKSICAKVLGPLQETKEGTGLLLRMSNSAASILGITDPKFTVRVTYFQ